MLTIRDIETRANKLVRRRTRTICAFSRSVYVCEIAPSPGYEWAEVFATSERGGRDKGDIFGRGAGDRVTSDGLAEKTADNVGEGREAVHPLPPAETGEGLQDTIAEQKEVS